MRIKIVQAEGIVKEAKHSHFTLHYMSDGRSNKKKIVSFGSSEVAYKALRDAKAGDEYDITSVKDDNGYWQWTEVTKAESGSSEPAGNTSGRKGDWETADERARRQVLIVRQSSIAQAVISVGNAGALDEILERAEAFEDWVTRE